MFRIRRTLPPAAAPLGARDLWNGLVGLLRGREECDHLERDIRRALGVKHCALVSSGRAALYLILCALRRLSNRREVVVPGYTCFSVPAAVVKAGLKVVPCDVSPYSLGLDHKCLRRLVGSNTLAVVAQHMFGCSEDLQVDRQIAEKGGALLVEDAAQTFGANANGCKAGTLADVGFFSLGRGKAVAAAGGGIIVTDEDVLWKVISREVESLAVASAARLLQMLGEALAVTVFLHPRLYWLPAQLPLLRLGTTEYSTGFRAERLSAFQAGLARRWKEKVERFNAERRANAEMLRRDLAACVTIVPQNGVRLPSGIVRLACLVESEETRRRLAKALRFLGVSANYPSAVTAIAELAPHLHREARCPVAEDIAKRLLTLPVHPFMRDMDRRRLTRAMRTYLKKDAQSAESAPMRSGSNCDRARPIASCTGQAKADNRSHDIHHLQNVQGTR